jgi:nickel-dependent lactate racemase
MAGHDRLQLSYEEARQALQSPLDSPRLSELAGGEQACIIIDDMPKPKPASRIVPFMLEKLHASGIAGDQIRFLCTPGTHRPSYTLS